MHRIRRFTLPVALFAVISGRTFAQPHAPTSPPSFVTTAEFAWLTGTWEGRLTKLPGALAEVVFQPPRAGVVTGVMRLTQGDTLLVIELISLVDTPHGPEMRFRHFSPALDAYETTFKQTMVLKSHDAVKDVFENLIAYDKTLMSTQPRVSMWERRGPDDMIARSDIIGDDGNPDVVEVTYRRRTKP